MMTPQKLKQFSLAVLLSLVLCILALSLRATDEPTTPTKEPIRRFFFAFLLDQSGSLGSRGLQEMRGIAQEMQSVVANGDRIGIWLFADSTTSLLKPQTISHDSAFEGISPESLMKNISGINFAGENTVLHDSLVSIRSRLDEVLAEGGETPLVVLVTDGFDEKSTKKPDEVFAAYEDAKIPVIVYPIAGNKGTNDVFLERLTQVSYGKVLSTDSKSVTEGIFEFLNKRDFGDSSGQVSEENPDDQNIFGAPEQSYPRNIDNVDPKTEGFHNDFPNQVTDLEDVSGLHPQTDEGEESNIGTWGYLSYLFNKTTGFSGITLNTIILFLLLILLLFSLAIIIFLRCKEREESVELGRPLLNTADQETFRPSYKKNRSSVRTNPDFGVRRPAVDLSFSEYKDVAEQNRIFARLTKIFASIKAGNYTGIDEEGILIKLIGKGHLSAYSFTSMIGGYHVLRYIDANFTDVIHGNQKQKHTLHASVFQALLNALGLRLDQRRSWKAWYQEQLSLARPVSHYDSARVENVCQFLVPGILADSLEVTITLLDEHEDPTEDKATTSEVIHQISYDEIVFLSNNVYNVGQKYRLTLGRRPPIELVMVEVQLHSIIDKKYFYRLKVLEWVAL